MNPADLAKLCRAALVELARQALAADRANVGASAELVRVAEGSGLREDPHVVVLRSALSLVGS